MKLTPGVNFINVLRAAFTRADPKSVKFQLSCQYHFTLLGSTHTKAARRTLTKLTPALWNGRSMFVECSYVDSVEQVVGLANGVCDRKAFSTFVNFDRTLNILQWKDRKQYCQLLSLAVLSPFRGKFGTLLFGICLNDPSYPGIGN